MDGMLGPRPSLQSNARRAALMAGFAIVAALFPAGLAAAEPPTPEAADQVVVRYRAGTTKEERGAVAREHGLTKVQGSANGRTEILVAKGRSPATARRQLAQEPSVVAVSPNSWRDLDDEITDEPFFEALWGLYNTGQSVDGTGGTPDIDIDGLEALRIERGDPSVVVAVIDDGVDFTHPDLAQRAWVNHAEADGLSGEDDDGNGYVDDVHGWDFCTNDATVGPEGADWHGTHVAGTIAASANGQGVVGVAPGISVMSLRTFASGGSCGPGDLGIIAAIDYAASFGVPVINASWSGPDRSFPLENAISDAAGTLLVAAAGNQASNMDGGGLRVYPAASPNPNILTVAAVNQTGHLAPFSNYGTAAVDIAAPGVNIVSTVPGEYGISAGTSMAVPHVAGVAALVLSVVSGTPTATALRDRILSTGAPLAATAGKTVTGRMVNALRAIDTVGPVATPINRHGINVGTIVGSTVSTTMTWPAATDALSGVKSYAIKRSLNGAAWTTLISSTTTRSYKRAMTFGTPTRFQLYARDGAGNLGGGAIGPTVTATLRQDTATSALTYTGRWSNVNLSSASGGRLHRTTRSGSTVTFTTTARAIAVIGRRGPLNGKAKVYVDGVYKETINLYRSSYLSKVVVFNTSWTSTAIHSVKLVAVPVSGRPRLDIDAFAFLR
jgi:subtilisin family serine protease